MLFSVLKRRPAQRLALEETGSFIIGGREIRYTIHRKARRRRSVAFYIEPSGRLRFVAPMRTKTATITNILHRRADWIEQKLNNLQENPTPSLPTHFKSGALFYYLGKPYTLSITHNTNARQNCMIVGDEFCVNLPDAAVDSSQEETRLEILLWYKKQARAVLKERTDMWCEQLGVHYRNLSIVNPTQQWGSCTAKNDIRLNWRVITGPIEVIDYLIVHELCHIVHKNHSGRFWRLVGSVLPDYKQRQKTLHLMDAGSTL